MTGAANGKDHFVPRAIWSGAISFGLVNVPVKLYTAVRKKDVHFHQLHAKDGVRIQQKRVCPKDGEEVPYDEIVKGYELSKDHYVVVEPEELDALDPEATHTIDIEDFVKLDEIDPLFFDSSYYLVPDARGDKAYQLLLQAMNDQGMVGIGRVVLRTKQYLAAVRPVDDALVLTTMNFADEVTGAADLDGLPDKRKAKPSKQEIDMAHRLIESLATSFDASKYHDTYRQRVLELVKAKAKGKEIAVQPGERESAPVVDLMAALEASLAEAKKSGPKAAPSKRKPTSSSKQGRRKAS
jgi:DNA end-binding protein Ku